MGDAFVVHGATVFDGTGAPGRRVDVSVVGGRIDAVGRGLEAPPGARTIDADGLSYTPSILVARPTDCMGSTRFPNSVISYRCLAWWPCWPMRPART